MIRRKFKELLFMQGSYQTMSLVCGPSMNSCTENGLSLAALLHHHDLKREIVSRCFRVGRSTAQRMMEGAWDDRILQINQAISRLRRAGCPDAAGDLAVLLLAGSAYAPRAIECTNGDLNGDGRRDTQDVVDGAIELAQHIVNDLAEFRRCSADRIYSAQEATALRIRTGKLSRLVDDLGHAVVLLSPGTRAFAAT